MLKVIKKYQLILSGEVIKTFNSEEEAIKFIQDNYNQGKRFLITPCFDTVYWQDKD